MHTNRVMVCDTVAQWWFYWLYCPTTEKGWWLMEFLSAFALICHFTENKGKRKNPPWMHVWPHLLMSACLLAHHFLWCVLKMGPKTFVGIILVLVCWLQSICGWGLKGSKIPCMEQKIIPLENLRILMGFSCSFAESEQPLRVLMLIYNIWLDSGSVEMSLSAVWNAQQNKGEELSWIWR